MSATLSATVTPESQLHGGHYEKSGIWVDIATVSTKFGIVVCFQYCLRDLLSHTNKKNTRPRCPVSLHQSAKK